MDATPRQVWLLQWFATLLIALSGLGTSAHARHSALIQSPILDAYLPNVVFALAPHEQSTIPESSSTTLQQQANRTSSNGARDSADAGEELHDPSDHPAVAAVIGIKGMIYDFTLESLKRRVHKARTSGADVIILELNTPGGVLTSALKISKYLKQMPELTVAWVNDEAYSAGILIASSCKQIVMAKHSATGDSAPVTPSGELGRRQVKKALGPLLAEFRDNAETNNYPAVLFHAMCVEGVKVYRIRHKQIGQIQYVNERDCQYMVDGTWTLGQVGEATAQPHTATSPNDTGEGIRTIGAVVQTVTAQQERAAWVLDDAPDKPSALVYDGSTFLTVTYKEAMELGLAKAIIDDDHQLKKYLNASEILRIKPTWSEDLAAKLTHPMVRAALMLALLLGAYMEFQTPGIGVAGLMAVLALITLIGAPLLVDLAETWHIILFFAGFGLLIVEIFITSGFGVLGITGLFCMLIGLILQGVPTIDDGRLFPMPAPEAWDQLRQSALWTMLAIVASLIGMYFITKHFGSIPLLNRLILSAPQGGGSVDLPISGDEAIGSGKITVGDVGQAMTGLRPTGRASIDGQTIDVISQGNWIDVGRPVRVVDVQGNKVIVDLAHP